MRMSKLGYFAEFAVLPGFLIALAIFAYDHATHPSIWMWLATFNAGLASWTLLEYLLHRFVFHHAPLISELHGRHHDAPLELIGSPSWISLAVGVVGILFPLWTVIGLPLAIAATSGIATGYLWYVFVHYATHHWVTRRGSYLYRMRLRHMKHHYAPDRCNFGVTTNIWDRVFGTALEPASRGTATPA